MFTLARAQSPVPRKHVDVTELGQNPFPKPSVLSVWIKHAQLDNTVPQSQD